jgi:hypothetical protein
MAEFRIRTLNVHRVDVTPASRANTMRVVFVVTRKWVGNDVTPHNVIEGTTDNAYCPGVFEEWHRDVGIFAYERTWQQL